MTVVDTHIHTIFSPDSNITPEQVINRARKLGIDIVCITDHSVFEESMGLEYYQSKTDYPLFIRGVELATNNGEILIFGLKNNFWNDFLHGVEMLPSARRVIDAVTAFGGVAIWSHPFRSYIVQHYDVDYARFQKVNILEGLNGRNSHKENNLALEYAKNNNLKIVGGSDAHRPEDIGKCLTLFKDNISTEEEFIDALKNSEYLPITFEDYKGKNLNSIFKN